MDESAFNFNDIFESTNFLHDRGDQGQTQPLIEPFLSLTMIKSEREKLGVFFNLKLKSSSPSASSFEI